jgi:hypothetical protein
LSAYFCTNSAVHPTKKNSLPRHSLAVELYFPLKYDRFLLALDPDLTGLAVRLAVLWAGKTREPDSEISMNDSLNHGFRLPPEQQAIRDTCFHPSGTFVEFPIEDVETSIRRGSRRL